MPNPKHRSLFSPASGLLIALAFLAGCITADGTLQQDGAATLTLTFPTAATKESDGPARALVSAPDVTIDALTITDAAPGERGPRRATAKLSTKKAATFDTVPLLRVIGTTIVHEPKKDGGGSFSLKVHNPKGTKPDDPSVAIMEKFPVSVRLHMPGPIVETSGTVKDGAVEWTFPASDWTVGKSLTLTITYGPATGKAAPGGKKDGSG
jgi:hypothetical protein